eukprot:1193509-Prorocentrum_minimum.AAC.6
MKQQRRSSDLRVLPRAANPGTPPGPPTSPAPAPLEVTAQNRRCDKGVAARDWNSPRCERAQERRSVRK